MKTNTLKILISNLKELNTQIKQYEISVKVGLKMFENNPQMFKKSEVETLRNRLSDFNKSKREVIECIEWVKSVDKKDIKNEQ